MNILKYTTSFLALVAFSAVLTACKDDKDEPVAIKKFGEVTIDFENVVGANSLQLNRTTPYETPAGDKFTVTTFRYYISNIKFTKANDSVYAQPESYYLIDQAREASRRFTIPNVPAGDYTGLTFTIGVDAARNSGGVQAGALAPSDMFWTWDTGYIFTKLEGRSDQSPNKGIVFHIGGSLLPHNTIRTVSPAMNGKIFQVRQTRTPEVYIKADVLRMFTGRNTIRFDSLNNVMGGADAVKIADNQAAGMFTVDRVQGN
jgi:hypothetical protein